MSDRVTSFPGDSERLHRNVEGADFGAVTHAVLDAVDLLRPAWKPLSVEGQVYGLSSADIIEAELVELARHRGAMTYRSSEGRGPGARTPTSSELHSVAFHKPLSFIASDTGRGVSAPLENTNTFARSP